MHDFYRYNFLIYIVYSCIPFDDNKWFVDLFTQYDFNVSQTELNNQNVVKDVFKYILTC